MRLLQRTASQKHSRDSQTRAPPLFSFSRQVATFHEIVSPTRSPRTCKQLWRQCLTSMVPYSLSSSSLCTQHPECRTSNPQPLEAVQAAAYLLVHELPTRTSWSRVFWRTDCYILSGAWGYACGCVTVCMSIRGRTGVCVCVRVCVCVLCVCVSVCASV